MDSHPSQTFSLLPDSSLLPDKASMRAFSPSINQLLRSMNFERRDLRHDMLTARPSKPDIFALPNTKYPLRLFRSRDLHHSSSEMEMDWDFAAATMLVVDAVLVVSYILWLYIMKRLFLE